MGPPRPLAAKIIGHSKISLFLVNVIMYSRRWCAQADVHRLLIVRSSLEDKRTTVNTSRMRVK